MGNAYIKQKEITGLGVQERNHEKDKVFYIEYTPETVSEVTWYVK